MINTAIAYMDYRKYDEAKRLLNKINEVYRQIWIYINIKQ